MTNSEILELKGNLERLSNVKITKLAWAIDRNKQIIKKYLNELSASEAPERNKLNKIKGEFEKARVKICEKYCNKDEKGKPVLKSVPGARNGEMEYDFPEEKVEDFREEMNTFRESALSKKMEKTSREFEEKRARKFEEEANINLYMYIGNTLPDDLDSLQVAAIKYIIPEDKLEELMTK